LKNIYFKKNQKGQVVVETAFVFSAMLLMVFGMMNLGVLLHTKNIATYSAFMAGRSYQVFGDQKNSDAFDESFGSGDQKLLDNLKNAAAIQVAEDIFTCSLPWVKVPDGEGSIDDDAFDMSKAVGSRCLENKREYKDLNVDIRFLNFEKQRDNLGSGDIDLEPVAGSFAELDRNPLRYGILSLRYRSPVLFDFGHIVNPESSDSMVAALTSFLLPGIQESGLVVDQVYVPILLNPGLESGIKKDDTEDEFLKKAKESVKK
jgi:hypothetical protein